MSILVWSIVVVENSKFENIAIFDNFRNSRNTVEFMLCRHFGTDIFSKSTKLLHLWNSNRCDVRIDIFERILDVHQEFCDVQSSEILTFKLKYLEYRQFSTWHI